MTAAELGNLSPQQLEEKQDALLVDIRTDKEWLATGVIPNSEKLQAFDERGNIDPHAWIQKLNKLKLSPEQPVILVCRSGNRSGTLGNFLVQQQGMENIYHLEHGIQSWIKAGKATQK